MKDCNKIENLLSEYLDGEAKDKSKIKKHLESCKECSERFEKMKRTARIVKDNLLKDELPALFNQRLMEKIHKTHASKFGFKVFIPRLAYTAAVVLIFLGIIFYTPIKDKFVFKPAKQPEQTVVYFTYKDHKEAEKIFLVSNNGAEDEEILNDLFSEDNGL